MSPAGKRPQRPAPTEHTDTPRHACDDQPSVSRALDYEKARRRDAALKARVTDELRPTLIPASARPRVARYASGCYTCPAKIEPGDTVYRLHLPAGWRIRCNTCGPFPPDFEETYGR